MTDDAAPCPDCGADPAEIRLAEATAILEAYPYPSEIDNPNAGTTMRRLCLWTDGRRWLDWTDRRYRFLHPEDAE